MAVTGFKNPISLINLDYLKKSGGIDNAYAFFATGLSGSRETVSSEEYIVQLQFTPASMDYAPDSNFAAIKTQGRNNPFYHYTGSEDTLSFDIEWLADEENISKTLMRARLLESWTKSDGDLGRPPVVSIDWAGNMFADATWFLVNAKYTLSRFLRVYAHNIYGESRPKSRDELLELASTATYGTGSSKRVFYPTKAKRTTRTPIDSVDGSPALSAMSKPELVSEQDMYPRIIKQSLVFKRIWDENPNYTTIISPTW